MCTTSCIYTTHSQANLGNQITAFAEYDGSESPA